MSYSRRDILPIITKRNDKHFETKTLLQARGQMAVSLKKELGKSQRPHSTN